MSVINQIRNGPTAGLPKTLGIAMGACVLMLAGCGSGPDASQNKQLYQLALGSFRGGKTSSPQVTQQQIAQVAASTSQPLVLVNIEKSKASALVLEIGRNGPVQTFATSARQTISLQNGMARGTRGLGGDLMSASLGQLPHLIAKKSGGQTQKEMRFLSGEDITVRYRFTCNVASSRVSLKPVSYHVVEDCRQHNGSFKFKNTYDVSGTGHVTRSRQWFGPTLEYIDLQHIRL